MSDELEEKLRSEFFKDLQVEHPDLEISDDGYTAMIPHFSHGRMVREKIDLYQMAKTAISTMIGAGWTAPPVNTEEDA